MWQLVEKAERMYCMVEIAPTVPGNKLVTKYIKILFVLWIVLDNFPGPDEHRRLAPEYLEKIV